MKLSEIKTILPLLEGVTFQLEDGTFVPEHFHVTEIGTVTKHFIDCGGTIRKEKNVNFQLWDANDYEHRLKPGKLLHIIQLSEDKLQIEDSVIEVEYQHGTIGKYDLAFNGSHFVLMNKKTACLASSSCGTASEGEEKKEACCSTNTTCC